MAPTVLDRFKKGWNAFFDSEKAEARLPTFDYGASFGSNPDRSRYRMTNEKDLMGSILTRIAIDVAAIDVRHVRLDQNGRYLSDMNSGLNNCLTLEANVDQAAEAFRQDAVMTLLEKGSIAIVPVDTDLSPTDAGGFDIKTLRVAEVVQWYPRHVTCRTYNDRTGQKKDLTLPKEFVAIVENPLYSIMNEPNSTLQRLIRKLRLLDKVDDDLSSGKLDIIIQLPYVVKTETKRQQAEVRRKDIEMQLKGSQLGIAYADATERITQLNRPVENNLLPQIEALEKKLYAQMGLTEEVFLGKADEATMLNYYNRTVEPILSALTVAMKRRFLTKTARTQLQSVEFYRDPFKLVPVSQIAEIADSFTRNEILSSNEVRAIIGYKPASDPQAEVLRNKNMPVESQPGGDEAAVEDEEMSDEAGQSEDMDLDGIFDSLDSEIARILGGSDDDDLT